VSNLQDAGASEEISNEDVYHFANAGAVSGQSGSAQRGWPLFFKRAVDLTISAMGLILLSPALLVIAVLIRITMGKPILFRQLRPGMGGRPFKILKFRTMTDLRDAQGRLLPDERRLTRLGRLLRKSSLDELPQLVNVFKGELSLVGPRPLLMKYLTLYSPRQAKRHNVIPGITGWSQVCGRNQLSWNKKLELDVWYVENWSIGLDLKILLKTITSIVRAEGISREGCATMPEFMGSTKGEL
jgi:lipopolysaccharide/colanic/teichoic acid biosynthesis glycosyltransferase